MNGQSFLIRVFACGMTLGFTAGAAHAASASGNLVHSDHTPAAGITVTVSNIRGRSAPVHSNGNGFYTLDNVPAGEYFLEVWVSPRTPKTVQVIIKEPSTPLPQVTVP